MTHEKHIYLKKKIDTINWGKYIYQNEQFKKASSLIIQGKKVLQLMIPNTFRFNTYAEWLEMENGETELIFARPKSSRVHDYDYGELISELNFKSPDIVKLLDAYFKQLEKDGIIMIKTIVPKQTTTPDKQNVSFTIGDPRQLIFTAMTIIYEKMQRLTNDQNELNDKNTITYDTIPTYMIIGHILYKKGLSHEEFDQLIELYRTRYTNISTSEELLIGDEKSIKILLSMLPELPIYQESHDELKYAALKAGKIYEESAVIDLKNQIVRKASFGEHYSVITELIAEHYADEFILLTQEEKDNFIMSNFKLIGTFYNSTSRYYQPSNSDVELHSNRILRKKKRNETKQNANTK